LLQRLHNEFYEWFGPLVEGVERRDNIQVLFFSNEKYFREYQGRHAPRMSTSVGFYSPPLDRFVLFNQGNSEQMHAMTKRLEARAEEYREQERMYGGAGRIEEWRRASGRRMARMADEQTRETVRHEGAHQLFFTYGVHSRYRVENDWLYEGLAVFCEGRVIGEEHRHRAGIVKSALKDDRLIPLPELVNHRSARGLFSFGGEEQVDLAYTEAWSLVHYLMQSEHRALFFDYLKRVRDPDAFWSVLDENRYDLLCRTLDMTPEELNDGWRAHVRRL
jgi:hypothetical protein